MASDQLILGFDTSAAHCAAALLRGDQVLGSRAEDMGRGQAERLMPLLEELLAESGKNWRDLDRIGVGVGPGNFTGIRISVSTARGLGLALGIPTIGVSTFDAIAFDNPGRAAIVPAPREQVYLRPFGGEPALVPAADVEGAVPPPPPQALAIAIARSAARADKDGAAPAPLYIRAADAAPSSDLPPVMLD